MLGEFVKEDAIQKDMFSMAGNKQNSKLMNTVDLINKKMGRNSIHLASNGFSNVWKMRQQNKSPRYTTNWDEICVCS